MKRSVLWSTALVAITVATAGLFADVKTRDKTTMKFEGFIGGFINRAAGGSDGTTSTVTVKANRLSTLNDTTGQIIDLGEENIYVLEVKKKEYRVMTFAEMRRQMEEARKSMEEQSKSMPPSDRAQLEEAGKQIEVDVDVKETGERKNIAGHDARQVVVTLTMREKGKTLEESGGFVLTNDMWLAPKVAALDELHEFYVKYVKAAFGSAFTGVDAQMANMISALIPGFGRLSERMAAEGRKLQGTAVMSTMTWENVKSAEQMKASSQQQSGGGGIGGAIAGRLMRGRGQTQPRTKAFTATHEMLSISTSATDADVAIPVGFKEKK